MDAVRDDRQDAGRRAVPGDAVLGLGLLQVDDAEQIADLLSDLGIEAVVDGDLARFAQQPDGLVELAEAQLVAAEPRPQQGREQRIVRPLGQPLLEPVDDGAAKVQVLAFSQGAAVAAQLGTGLGGRGVAAGGSREGSGRQGGEHD